MNMQWEYVDLKIERDRNEYVLVVRLWDGQHPKHLQEIRRLIFSARNAGYSKAGNPKIRVQRLSN